LLVAGSFIFKIKILILISFVFAGSFAHSGLSPEFSVYSGQIILPDTLPLEGPNVTFTVQIASPGLENCILYSERHIVDMSGSEGIFSLKVGQGTLDAADPGIGFVMTGLNNKVFDVTSYPSLSCSVGAS